MAALQIIAWIVGGMLIGLAAVALAHGVLRHVAAAGPRVATLADPTRCPDCGRPYEAHDDVVSPHECPEDGPDPDRLEAEFEAEYRGIEDGRRVGQ